MVLINDDTAKFLMVEQTKILVLYALPKIHKQGSPSPGNTIVGSMGSILHPLVQFIDFLQPFVGKIESYIKDTKHFISL